MRGVFLQLQSKHVKWVLGDGLEYSPAYAEMQSALMHQIRNAMSIKALGQFRLLIPKHHISSKVHVHYDQSL